MFETAGTLRIVTPEGVVFRFALAGITARFLAWAIDAAIVIGFAGAVSTLLKRSGLVQADLAKALFTLLYFVVSVGYSMYFEWYWRGQTIGKKVLRLRVMDSGALHLQPYQVVLRNLMRYVDSLPLCYLVGGIAALLSRRSQRLGDMVSHTVVIKALRFHPPDLDRIGRAKYNSLMEHPALCARFRQRTPPEATALAMQALLRRDQLTAEARIETFRALAAYFGSRASVPAEILEQITPEQLVRNVVEVLCYVTTPAVSAGVSSRRP
jgi:uncharacterized RDD family membrane protein YckC